MATPVRRTRRAFANAVAILTVLTVAPCVIWSLPGPYRIGATVIDGAAITILVIHGWTVSHRR